MEKKVIITLFATLLLFGFVNLVFVNYFGFLLSPVAITGHVVNDSGIVQVFINQLLNVNIYSPENITYNFNKGDLYIIPLNVSADFNVEPVDGWRYWLYDLTHDIYVEDGTLFTPNSSISAVRWGNLLTVSALSDQGEWVNKSVVFEVNVSNSAPIIENFSDPLFTCEGESLDYKFTVTDIDEDDVVGDISPKNPFYLISQGRIGVNNSFDIVSGVLDKGDVGNYSEVISAIDPWDAIDSKNITIEVIEINNLPIIKDIGAQTVWLSGENSKFYYVVDVTDVEDGNTKDGKLNFSLNWSGNENLFDIGLSDGIMNYTPVVGQEGHVYDLEVCVTDNALRVIHDNISLCAPMSGDSHNICDSFTLTVTNDNRAPEILSYSPINDTFKVSGDKDVNYSVEVYDADGTIPDIDWYVDDVRIEHNENISKDSFIYKFGCDVSGAHKVEIVTSDGLLNDSHEWFVDVSRVACPIFTHDGGGGAGGDFCVENWVCDDWNICQNVKRTFDSGMMSLEDYSVAKDSCSQNKEDDERFCGFQITKCYDLAKCERADPIIPKPLERQFCYFTENPGCNDGITNCHDGACEVLADCGGPCSPCPTCSDGKQNQGEDGVDCGGPCPFMCEPEVPFAKISNVLIIILIILIIIILWILLRLFLFWKRRNKDSESPVHD